jgi:hypothetical protein
MDQAYKETIILLVVCVSLFYLLLKLAPGRRLLDSKLGVNSVEFIFLNRWVIAKIPFNHIWKVEVLKPSDAMAIPFLNLCNRPLSKAIIIRCSKGFLSGMAVGISPENPEDFFASLQTKVERTKG